MIEEGPFTELIAALGQAVRELDVPEDLREVVQRCMREVRKAK